MDSSLDLVTFDLSDIDDDQRFSRSEVEDESESGDSDSMVTNSSSSADFDSSPGDDTDDRATSLSAVEREHYIFVQEPSQDIFCPVTLDVMHDPCQTRCCGNHLSLSAACRLKRMKKRCPLCKKIPLRFVEDKYFQRVVLGTKIHCDNKESGCTWVGEIRERKSHLGIGCNDDDDQRDKRCKFVGVPCTYECGMDIQRYQLENHKIRNCLKRPFSCPHCGCTDTYTRITEDHWPECEKFPLQCPNECSSDSIQRQSLKRHLNEDCLQQEIACEFSYSGCNSRVKRFKMNEHMDESVQYHLRSLAKYTLQLHAHIVDSLSSSWDITFQNFKQFHRSKQEWYSPAFYTHVGGYKMCLGIDVNGFSHSPSTHLGVAIYMMRGEFDNDLQWPFKGIITVELVRGRNNYAVDIVEENSHLEHDYKDIFSGVTSGERSAEGWGFTEFISHKNLYKPRKGRRYLEKDTLHFKITRILVNSI